MAGYAVSLFLKRIIDGREKWYYNNQYTTKALTERVTIRK